MLITLETGRAEAAYNLHNRMVRDLLESDVAVGQFTRRIIPLMRVHARNTTLPDIRHILVANSIGDMLADMEVATPTHQPRGVVHADNT